MGLNIPQNPNGKAQASAEYDSVEFSLIDGQVDYDLDANQSELFRNVKNPYYLEIATTAAVTIKFNSASNAAITLAANALRIFDRQAIRNIYLTNASGGASTMKLYLK